MIRVEVSSDHGVDVFDLPSLPREGDYLRVPSSAYSDDRDEAKSLAEAAAGRHGDEQCERVRYVLWNLEDVVPVVTIDTDCVVAP